MNKRLMSCLERLLQWIFIIIESFYTINIEIYLYRFNKNTFLE